MGERRGAVRWPETIALGLGGIAGGIGGAMLGKRLPAQVVRVVTVALAVVITVAFFIRAYR